MHSSWWHREGTLELLSGWDLGARLEQTSSLKGRQAGSRTGRCRMQEAKMPLPQEKQHSSEGSATLPCQLRTSTKPSGQCMPWLQLITLIHCTSKQP